MIHIDSWSKYQSSGIIVRQNWSPLLLNARCGSSQINKDLTWAKNRNQKGKRRLLVLCQKIMVTEICQLELPLIYFFLVNLGHQPHWMKRKLHHEKLLQVGSFLLGLYTTGKNQVFKTKNWAASILREKSGISLTSQWALQLGSMGWTAHPSNWYVSCGITHEQWMWQIGEYRENKMYVESSHIHITVITV